MPETKPQIGVVLSSMKVDSKKDWKLDKKWKYYDMTKLGTRHHYLALNAHKLVIILAFYYRIDNLKVKVKGDEDCHLTSETFFFI